MQSFWQRWPSAGASMLTEHPGTHELQYTFQVVHRGGSSTALVIPVAETRRESFPKIPGGKSRVRGLWTKAVICFPFRARLFLPYSITFGKPSRCRGSAHSGMTLQAIRIKEQIPC